MPDIRNLTVADADAGDDGLLLERNRARRIRSGRRCGRGRRRSPIDAAPTPIPLLAPSGPVAGPITDAGRAAGLGRPAGGARRWTGRDRRRTRVRLPLRLARLPGAAAPAGPGHRAARPDPARRPERPGPAAGRVPSGCCTRRTRTCPAWPRSASGRGGCSTPNWPADWPACPGRARPAGRADARAAPAQGARRGRLVDPAAAARLAGLRRTGRRGAGRTARRDGGPARPAGQAGVGAAGVRGHRRCSAGAAAGRPVAPHLRHAPDHRPTRAGRHPRAVDTPGLGRPPPGRRTAPDPARLRDHRGGDRPAHRRSAR